MRGEACDEERSAPENGPESLDIEESYIEQVKKVIDQMIKMVTCLREAETQISVDERLCSVLVKQLLSCRNWFIFSFAKFKT